MIVVLLIVINLLLLLVIGIGVAMIYGKVKTTTTFSDNEVKSLKRKHRNETSYKKNSEDLQLRINKQADDALNAMSMLQRFVPKQFIEHFRHHGLDSIELGHAIDTNVSIMFCDIRDFTGLAENMQPKELMNFLNSYFYRMNARIHENAGFIDKFIGDAILAIFDRHTSNENSSVDAINASIEIYKALELYNSHRQKSGYQPIKIAIGLHHGSAVLGTVGSEDRMDTTVIGDTVNVAERIEKLSTEYDVDILVSGSVLNNAKKHSNFAYRFVDRLRVKGRQKIIDVYEVFDHLSDQQRSNKISVADLIEQGVMNRMKYEWDDALACFEEAIKREPQDRLAFYHLKKCIELRNAHRAMLSNDELDILI